MIRNQADPQNEAEGVSRERAENIGKDIMTFPLVIEGGMITDYCGK